MALTTAAAREHVAALFIAYLGRAPEFEAMNFYVGQLNGYVAQAGGNVGDALLMLSAEIYANAGGAGEIAVGPAVSNEEFITSVYWSALGRAPDAGGLAHYVELLEAGVLTREIFVHGFLDNVRGQVPGTRDYDYLANRTEVALEFARFENSAPSKLPLLPYDSKSILEGVDETRASVIAALERIHADEPPVPPPPPPDDAHLFILTSGIDQADITGSFRNGGLVSSDFKFTSANEKVIAPAGTLNTGDVLMDGSTTDHDVLDAVLVSNVLFEPDDEWDLPIIAPTIVNIETINLEFRTPSLFVMDGVEGATNLNITASSIAPLFNVNPASAPVIGLSGSGMLMLGLTGLEGAADALSLRLDGAAASDWQAMLVPSWFLSCGCPEEDVVLETLNIESTGTAPNTLVLGSSFVGLNEVIVTGSADLDLFVALDSDASEALLIDGTAATGSLMLDASGICGCVYEFEVELRGGEADDVLIGGEQEVSTTFDLSAGGNDTVIVLAGDINDTLIGFTSGDKLAIGDGSESGTFVNGLDAETSGAGGLPDAAGIAFNDAVDASITGHIALLFEYEGGYYIFMHSADAGDYGEFDENTDVIVALSGTPDPAAFGNDTFYFLSLPPG